MTAVEQYTTKVRQQHAATEAERRRRWAEVTGLWEQCCQAEGAERGASGFRPANPYRAVYEASLAGYIGVGPRR
jgi:hypothetical protein